MRTRASASQIPVAFWQALLDTAPAENLTRCRADPDVDVVVGQMDLVYAQGHHRPSTPAHTDHNGTGWTQIRPARPFLLRGLLLLGRNTGTQGSDPYMKDDPP